MSACELTPLHKACISCPSISNTLILLSEHNRTCSNSMKDKPLNFRFDFFFVEMILWDVIFIDGSMGLPICQIESFWPQNLERSTVTESKLSDQKKPKIQMQNLTEVMSRMFSLPKMERVNAGPERNSATKDTRLCGHSPEPLRVIRDDSQRLCVLTSPLSLPLTIFRIKKKERKKESNHPS